MKTRMQVRAADPTDAAVAAAIGVDAVEIVVGDGLALDPGTTREIRAAFPGVVRVSCDDPSLEAISMAADLGVNEIAMTVDATSIPASFSEAARFRDLVYIARIPAKPDAIAVVERVRDRVDAVMFEAERDARIFGKAGIGHLDACSKACRSRALPFGFAGALEAPDVPRLLLLQPDVLGFDHAIRIDQRADRPLAPEAVEAVRALIPRDDAKTQPTTDATKMLDRVFVRDFLLPLSIGAYKAEQGGLQRVRFSVDAAVLREPAPPRDMRDVFSYDVIIETIRVCSEGRHVTFVEGLAEEIAASLLARAAIENVRVKVEKVDVIEGSVGIEIYRERAV